MQCGKLNKTTISLSRKTNEINRFKVKIWGGFDLTILKVKQIYYDKMKYYNKFKP